MVLSKCLKSGKKNLLNFVIQFNVVNYATRWLAFPVVVLEKIVPSSDVKEQW